MTPQQLALEVENLFTLPELYLKLKATIDDPKSTVTDVAVILEQDPNLTAKLLRLVNSAFFGLATQIDSIARAVNLMGLAQVHDLVLTVSTVNAFKGINSQLINMKEFWLHSVYCAAIAKLLARRCHIIDSDRLFVTGILHDVGHLVMYTQMSSHAEKLLEQAKAKQSPLAVLERAVFGFDYAEVGGELLKRWQLPASVYQAIYFHSRPDPELDFALEAAIVHIANILVLQDESDKRGYPAPPFNPVCFQLTAIDEEELALIKLEAKKNMADILKLLFTR